MIGGIADWHRLFSHSDHFLYISELSLDFPLFRFICFMIMSSTFTLPSPSPTYVPPDDTNISGFLGYTLLAVIYCVFALVGIMTLCLLSSRRCRASSPTADSIELDELPSFVNPELAGERLHIHSMSTIDLPPTAYLRPSDTFPDLDNSRPPPLEINHPHQARFLERCLRP